MKKYLLILLLLVVPVTGCSSLGSMGAALVGGAASNGIDTELTVGTKTQEMQNQVGNNYAAQTIQNVQEIPLSFLLLMILGWLLPSPGEIWGGFVKLLPWRKR